jgi:hypothetical protein
MSELSYTKLLSGSTNGRPINVAAASTPGTLIHQTPSVAGTQDVHDQIFIYAINTSNQDQSVTIEFGGTTNPDDLLPYTLAPDAGLVLIVPGLLLNNNLIVRAYGSSSINLSGYVCRMPVNTNGMTNLR